MTQPGTALLTLGRLPVAVELARSLHRLGWRVVVADPLPVHIARLSRAVARSVRVRAPVDDPDGYLDDLVAACAREAVDVVVPVSEETPHVARLKGRAGFGVPVLCAAPEAVLALHDKWRFAAWAARAGLAVPETERCDTPAAAALAARADHVIKPRLSASGRGVSFGRAGRPLAVRAATHLVQRRLGPRSLCTCTLASGGVPSTSVAYRARLTSGSVAVRFESVAIPSEVRRAIETCTRAHAVDGAISFDFLADERGAWHVIECNPRATSGLHLMGRARLDAALERCLRAVAADAPPSALSSAPSGAPSDAGPAAGERPSNPVEIEPGRVRQELWSSLTELQGRALRGRIDRADWRALVRTPDVTWSREDPWPCLGMTPASAPLLWRAIRQRRRIGEVAVQDVGWYVDRDEVGP